MKKWGIKQFIFRTFLCFVLIGGAVLFVTYRQSNQSPAPTAAANKVLLTGLLTENALRGNSLADFSQSDPQTAETLTRLVKELENNTDSVAQTAKIVTLSPEQATSIEAVIATQRDAIEKYRLANGVFAKAITYDPIEDLTLIDPLSQRTEIVSRANAAAAGLEKIVSPPADTSTSQLGVGTVDGPQALVQEPVRQAINEQVACLRNVAAQSEAAAAQVKAAIKRCTDSYPELRRMTVQNVLALSFNQEYKEKLNRLTISLLDRLKQTSS